MVKEKEETLPRDTSPVEARPFKSTEVTRRWPVKRGQDNWPLRGTL